MNILKTYPNLKNNILNLDFVCNELCKLDNNFPPNDLWLDYYKINELKNIILNKSSKKRNILL